MPRLSQLHDKTKRKSALLVTLAILINCLVQAPLAARTTLPPEPAPAQTDSIRQISLTTNDLVYNNADQTLYASVPSSAGSGGNSITPINPNTGEVGSSVFIGSEPNKLALSDDGQTLYASLDGASSIRRFDLTTKTPGQQFSVGRDQYSGPYNINDLAVAPGNPNLVAVARAYGGTSPPEAGVAIFDNGVQRSKTGPGHTSGSDFLAFSASPSKLYGTGYYSGLTTMTIDSSGVTVSATTSFSANARIKFDNGYVYSSTGQVVNPDTGTLLGTFNGVSTSAFAVDSSAGRAYYVINDPNNSSLMLLKAFDINTFLPVGSLSIAGVKGQATSMVRWGANGLAFRTSSNQVFLIQTSLIPSSSPIPEPTPTPTPSPTPTPTPVALSIRQVPLATNDLIYNQATQKLYASIPSSVGSSGNSIVPIDPTDGAVGNSVYVGSEPRKLALSDDGQALYVALDGAGAVRRFDIASQTAGAQFSLGNANFNGPLFVSDLAVMPGSPQTVAVARTNREGSPSYDGVAIYDNGTMRPKTTANSSSYNVEFGSSPARLYSSGALSGIDKISVDQTGLTSAGSIPGMSGSDFKFDHGLLYTPTGVVIDPEAGVLTGRFTGLNSDPRMAVDYANGRVFFLSFSGSLGILRAYDINTFLLIGSVSIQNLDWSTTTSLVRWGANGLAFRTPTKVFLIQTSLVSSSSPVPEATPTPSPTPTPTPAYIPTFVRKLNLPANDLAYKQSTQTLYASVPSVAGANGNSITPINPQTGAIGSSVFVGSEPYKMALSDDEGTLYVSLHGASAIRRFDTATQTPGLQFTPQLNFRKPSDMAVMPGNPQSLVLTASEGVAVYDNGVQRPNVSKGDAYAIDRIEFSASPNILYGYDNQSSGFELVKLAVDANGVKGVSTTRALITGFGVDIKFAGGLLYSSAGRVVDPENQRLLGLLSNVFGQSMTVDPSVGRVFFIANSGSNAILSAYDINTFLPLGTVTLQGVSGTPLSLVRWGVNGLAFRTGSTFGPVGPTDSSQIYLIQSALVSPHGTLPTALQLAADKATINEGSSPLTVTVMRSGDVSSATSVDYTTSDVTATAGSDYTATSGTLTFEPGQLSKTVTIPIINDLLYEGSNETFNFTLSNPTGGTVFNSPITELVTILDNDSVPLIRVPSTLTITEGHTGTTSAVFTVSLSNPTVQTVTVDYATIDGTAKAGSDYVATSGTLTIPAGASSATVTVPVNGDALMEADENFIFKISGATNVSFISNTQTAAKIVNDDFQPPLYLILDESGPEPNQAAALDSQLLLRDPFPVISAANLLDELLDKNTRVIVFVANLQLAQGAPPTSVVVTLTDANNQGFDVAAESVQPVPLFSFTQVVFRLPDNLMPGTYTIMVKARDQISNSGTIRIRN